MILPKIPAALAESMPRLLKQITVGSSSENSSIRAYGKYRVRIGTKWYEGGFSKRWFGWNFDDFETSGMQLNLIDEVFEIQRKTQGRIRHG